MKTSYCRKSLLAKMVKTALKRAISDEEEQPSPSRRKKPRKKTVAQDTGNVTSEDIVKEFLKLTAVKQTRLKGDV